MRVIGDIHGKFDKYSDILSNSNYSIQVGDFGNKETWELLESSKLKSDNHKIVAGNHDYFNDVRYSHGIYLPDYITVGDYSAFVIPGANSIELPNNSIDIEDQFRELSYQALDTGIELYESVKPNIVVSHDCPYDIYPFIITNGLTKINRTADALSVMFEIYSPDLWVFGHHHVSFQMLYKGCQFICLKECQYLTVSDNINDVINSISN